MNPSRPCPDDFATVAPTLTQTALTAHYGADYKMVQRWAKETGVSPCAHKRPTRPIPPGFEGLAPNLSQNELARHYKVARKTVALWVAQTGAKTRGTAGRVEKIKPADTRGGWREKVHHIDARQIDRYTIAADTLRRERFPVNRCDERGRYAERGEFWRVGNVVCTPDELIERAAKYQREAA